MKHEEIQDMEQLLVLLKEHPAAARAWRRLSRSCNIAWGALHNANAAVTSVGLSSQEMCDQVKQIVSDAKKEVRDLPYE